MLIPIDEIYFKEKVKIKFDNIIQGFNNYKNKTIKAIDNKELEKKLKEHIREQNQEMYITDEEICKLIFRYIKKENTEYAVLINGKWGAGKTFFVKNSLKTNVQKEINKTIFKQLLYYFAIPMILPIIISIPTILIISQIFTIAVTIEEIFKNIAIVVGMLILVYGIYFIATDVQFNRNINGD